MKIRIHFKTPDAVDYAIRSAVKREIPSDEEGRTKAYLVVQERDKLGEELRTLTDKFVSHGESVVIEFDTETNSAIVVEKGK